MKFLASQFAYLLSHQESRGNLRALLKYLAFLALLVTVYAVLFHIITQQVEGHTHSWITGFYWVLVVMTTLGLGDITMTSDLGRLFSIVVLLSGVVFLLVMLPFLFIRLFYAPWLEARIRLRAPRDVPAGTRGHVILTEHDDIAAALIPRLRAEHIPYFVVEPDPTKAARMIGEQIAVVTGENDSRATYERLATPAARLLLANCVDTVNTNITLTAREVAPDVPIASIIEADESADILALSGASWVLPLKRQLGEYLAARVDTGRPEAHIIGRFKTLRIAELPARDTAFTGMTVRHTRLRERFGVSVVGLWQRGALKPAYPDTVIAADSVLVLAGSATQIAALDSIALREAPATTTTVSAPATATARTAETTTATTTSTTSAHTTTPTSTTRGTMAAEVSSEPPIEHAIVDDSRGIPVDRHESGTTTAASDAASSQTHAQTQPRTPAPAPVLIIGAGKVGHAAAHALVKMGVAVHIVDRSAKALRPLRGVVARTLAGDAADRALLDRAGIDRAPSVLLTTNDDAMNIYLAVYCRKLNPHIRIVSRITHERNVEAIHRAGADFAISYTSLGVEAVMSLLQQHEPVLLGEGVRLFSIPVPASLAGGPLSQSGIGSTTGMSVVGLAHDDRVIAPLTAETILPPDAELLMLGSLDQRRTFSAAFEEDGDETR